MTEKKSLSYKRHTHWRWLYCLQYALHTEVICIPDNVTPLADSTVLVANSRISA